MLEMIRGLKVGDVMHHPVICTLPGNPADEVADQMAEKRISGMPVVDASQNVIGIISERDRLMAIRQERILSTLAVSEIMRHNPITIDIHSSLPAAIKAITDQDIMRLPVLENGKLVGILTRHDILKKIIKQVPGFLEI